MRCSIICAAAAVSTFFALAAQASEMRTVPVGCTPLRPAPIDRLPTRVAFDIQYPKSESEELGEGWVQAYYTVSASGAVTNVETVDMLGSKAYAAALQDALKAARYEPALKGGKPIDYYGYKFEVAFAMEGRNRAGVHYFGFSRAYDEAKRRREAKKFDEAIAVVKEAMTEPLNMYELPTLSHNLAYTYLALNDKHRALVAIRHAAVRGGQFLAKEAAPYALALLAKLEAENNNQNAALCAFQELQSKFAAFAPDDELKRLIETAQAQLTATDPIRTDIELVDSGRAEVPSRWTHILTRPTFSFDAVPQAGAKFRAVCGTSMHEDIVVAGRDWHVDPADGSCTLLFYGGDGVKFTLIEK